MDQEEAETADRNVLHRPFVVRWPRRAGGVKWPAVIAQLKNDVGIYLSDGRYDAVLRIIRIAVANHIGEQLLGDKKEGTPGRVRQTCALSKAFERGVEPLELFEPVGDRDRVGAVAHGDQFLTAAGRSPVNRSMRQPS